MSLENHEKRMDGAARLLVLKIILDDIPSCLKLRPNGLDIQNKVILQLNRTLFVHISFLEFKCLKRSGYFNQ
jgi:hypothetical protein